MKPEPQPPDLRIDYESHPAYRELLERGSPDVPELDRLMASLDRNFEEFVSIPGPVSPWEMEAFIAGKVRPLIEEMKRLVWKNMSEGDAFRESTCAALESLGDTFVKEFRFRNAQKGFRSPNLREDAEKVRDALDREGISLHRIPRERVEAIWESLAEHRAELEQRRSAKPKGMASCVKSIPLKGGAFRVFRKELERLGIMDGVKAHSRHKMDLDYCALHLSHEHEDWYRDCYGDVGLPLPRATYMHFDQDFALVKAMVYLRDFDDTIGPLAPFALVKREHTNHWSYAKRVFFKELDYANEKVANGDPETKTTYYRKQFKFPKYRREFLKIPRQLQGSSHFGDDLLDTSPLAEYLISRETKLLPQVANCAVFTGGHNVHRGGMVPRGERWAIQVGFRMREPGIASALKRARLKAGLHAPGFIKKAIRLVKGR
jgi:hypothetical protein